MDLQPGTVVGSIRGHDEGVFAVIRTEGRFAYLADGKHRPLEKPKKKSLKHLQATGIVLDLSVIGTNRQLKAALRTAFEKEDLAWPRKM